MMIWLSRYREYRRYLYQVGERKLLDKGSNPNTCTNFCQENPLLYIRESVIALLIIIAAYFGITHKLDTRKIEKMDSQIVEYETTLKELAKKSDELKSNLVAAQKQSEKVRTVYREKIRDVRSAAIPADCHGAINHVLRNKETLQWPNK